MDSESRLQDEIGQIRFAEAIAKARLKLRPPTMTDATLQALSAAAFFAICAMAFCVTAVLAPANVTTPAARSSVN